MARKEGIDFILDPMWGNASSSLTEHVDGVHSPDIVRIISAAIKEAPLSRPPWWKDPAQAANEPAVDGEALVIDEALTVDD
ncbi:hypothetical protein D3C76_717020 [compost metagenome]